MKPSWTRPAWWLAALMSLGLVLGGLPSTAQAAPRTCTSTPFRSNPGKHVVYRIPAIVVTTRGTVLAFAERRRSTSPSADTGDVEVVLARSTDRGCHWSTPRRIADRGRDTVGNPVPVVDRTTGTVLLFTVLRARGGGTTAHGLHLQRSNDDGRTFTRHSRGRVDVSKIRGWHGGLTGPGHAIQLRAAKSPHRGRIVVPMGYKRNDRYGVYGLVSDNHGRSWRVAYNTVTDGRIEGTVAELPDGRLWISYRNRNVGASVGTGRVGAFSRNGGSSLAGPLKRSGLPVVSVQGSSLGLTGRHAGILLFSSPAGRDRTRRERMAIFVSSGSKVGTRWRNAHQVQPDKRPGAYSDLVQLSDTTIGILYETGQRSWKERIEFRSIRLSAVLG